MMDLYLYLYLFVCLMIDLYLYLSLYLFDLLKQNNKQQEMESKCLEHLTKEFETTEIRPSMTHLEKEWLPFVLENSFIEQNTGIEIDRLVEIGRSSVDVKQDNFILHKTLVRAFVGARTKKLEEAITDPNAKVLDWATCEALAVGR
jgi:hypothetical protein